MSNQLYRIAVTLSSHDSVIRNHKNCSGLNSPLAPEWTRIKEFASHTLRYLSQLDFQSALFRSTMISGGASENTQVKQACQGAFFTSLPGDTNGPRGPLPYPSPQYRRENRIVTVPVRGRKGDNATTLSPPRSARPVTRIAPNTRVNAPRQTKRPRRLAETLSPSMRPEGIEPST